MNRTVRMPKPNHDDLLKSLQEIYKYIYNNFVDSNSADREQQQRIKRDFQSRECLWDEETQTFWQPKYAFKEDVSFFGSRRVTIKDLDHRTQAVYDLLGQKSEPKVDDYLDFLQELLDEYKTDPLTEEDKDCVLQVLKKLEPQLSLEERSVQDIPLLTEGGTLRSAKKTLISDALWWQTYIDKNILLDPKVSVTLAKSTGSRSLLRDVTEEATESQSDGNPTVKSWCHKWEITLNSSEFNYGLNRLIYHEYDLCKKETIKTPIQIFPAQKIELNLFLDNSKIASRVKGVYYFDPQSRFFYINSCTSQETMVGYLAEAINSRMKNSPLKNLLPLARILDAEPSKIKTLLNELRIRSLPGEVDEPSETTSIEESLKADTQISEEETTQASDQDIKASAHTDTGKSENSVYWGEFGEAWARRFYKSCGYNIIKKQPDWEGFDFLCEESGRTTIKAEVKAITATRPNIPITINEWSKMVELGNCYELLIVSHQGDSVSEIIRIQHLWSTLTNDFLAKLREKKLTTWDGDEAEVLLGFNLNSNKQENKKNNLIISWHRLCEGNYSENIKRYRPTPSTVNSENQEVKFEPIP